MKCGSLFSGIGAIELGLERAGMETVWQVEIDDFARSVLATHWPGVRRYGDIRQLSPASLEPVDLIAGGFPCTDISVLGPRTGLAGKHSGLWAYFAAIVRHLRPRFVLVENVTELYKRGMAEVLADLSAGGYDAEWECVPAAALGAAHLRARVWLLAYPRGFGERLPEGSVFAGRLGSLDRSGWPPEPELDRVADGSADDLDRRRRFALGNSAVPQISEFIGRRLMALCEPAV